MRKKLLTDGAKELSYEIREIVKKANQLKALGLQIHWENIGDPIEKKCQLPQWIKDIVGDIVQVNRSYCYCPSKGILDTRQFLAEQTNKLGGVQITADDILFFNGLGDAIATVYGLLSMTTRIIGPSPAYSTHSSAEAAPCDKNGQPFLHSHAVFSQRRESGEIAVTAGHLTEARIGYTGEIVLTAAEKAIARKFDDVSGIEVWDLS